MQGESPIRIPRIRNGLTANGIAQWAILWDRPLANGSGDHAEARLMPRFDRPLFRKTPLSCFGDENQRIAIPRRYQPPLRLTAKAISRSHSQTERGSAKMVTRAARGPEAKRSGCLTAGALWATEETNSAIGRFHQWFKTPWFEEFAAAGGGGRRRRGDRGA